MEKTVNIDGFDITLKGVVANGRGKLGTAFIIPMILNQIEFEHELISALLLGSSSGLNLLREHFNHADIVSREMSGAGFFLEFKVDSRNVKKFSKNISFGDIYIKADELPNGAGAVVHIRSGYLDMLEGYSFDDEWPTTFSNLEISYSNKNRNFSDLDAL